LNEIFFLMKAQINITITRPVLPARYVKYTRLEGLERKSPPKRERLGFVIQQIGIQRLEPKTIPCQIIYITNKYIKISVTRATVLKA